LPESLVDLLEAHADAALADDDAQPDLFVVGDGVVELEQARMAVDEVASALRVEEGEPELVRHERRWCEQEEDPLDERRPGRRRGEDELARELASGVKGESA
jgi:hypothetical protein